MDMDMDMAMDTIVEASDPWTWVRVSRDAVIHLAWLLDEVAGDTEQTDRQF